LTLEDLVRRCGKPTHG